MVTGAELPVSRSVHAMCYRPTPKCGGVCVLSFYSIFFCKGCCPSSTARRLSIRRTHACTLYTHTAVSTLYLASGALRSLILNQREDVARENSGVVSRGGPIKGCVISSKYPALVAKTAENAGGCVGLYTYSCMNRL